MSVIEWCIQHQFLRSTAMLFLVFVVFLMSTKGRVQSAFFAVPAGFNDSLVANGLTNPTAMEFAPDGRLFVCEQGGSLRVIKNGALLATPFVTITVNSTGERGLLGIAFDPDFANNQYVYVYYTARRTESTCWRREKSRCGSSSGRCRRPVL